MQDFSDWMCTLRNSHEQQQYSSPRSVASSTWSDTDCETDSDGEDMQGCLLLKRAKNAPSSRTAPIMIPTSSRRRPASPVHQSADESLDLSFHASERLAMAGRFTHPHNDEMDEDDMALYGNLAFFRSQHNSKGLSRAHAPLKSRSVSSTSTVDADDDEIFDMEL